MWVYLQELSNTGATCDYHSIVYGEICCSAFSKVLKCLILSTAQRYLVCHHKGVKILLLQAMNLILDN